MRKILAYSLVFSFLLSGCVGASDQADAAEQSLNNFFDKLSKGDYAGADEYYGGSYEILLYLNPLMDPDDHVGLWKNACTINGLQCLPVRSATFNKINEAGEYIFSVQYTNPDGSIFELGACCGEELTTPPKIDFEYRVVSRDGDFLVLDLPVSLP